MADAEVPEKPDLLCELLVQYGKDCEGKEECGLRDDGGAAHGCRCAYCVGFRKLQCRIKSARHKKLLP